MNIRGWLNLDSELITDLPGRGDALGKIDLPAGGSRAAIDAAVIRAGYSRDSAWQDGGFYVSGALGVYTIEAQEPARLADDALLIARDWQGHYVAQAQRFRYSYAAKRAGAALAGVLALEQAGIRRYSALVDWWRGGTAWLLDHDRRSAAVYIREALLEFHDLEQLASMADGAAFLWFALTHKLTLIGENAGRYIAEGGQAARVSYTTMRVAIAERLEEAA